MKYKNYYAILDDGRVEEVGDFKHAADAMTAVRVYERAAGWRVLALMNESQALRIAERIVNMVANAAQRDRMGEQWVLVAEQTEEEE